MLVFKNLIHNKNIFKNTICKAVLNYALKKSELGEGLKNNHTTHMVCLNYETFMSVFYWKKFLI